MKIGDKVYCQSRAKDLLIIGFSGNEVQVYDDEKISYFSTQRSDLLEYETSPRKFVTPNPCGEIYARNTAICGLAPQTKTKKEGLKMNVSKLFGEFGKVKNGEVALTFGGQVVIRRNADEYVCYDEAQEQIVNHMSLVFQEASKMLFILPVTAVDINDVIKVKGEYFQVLKVNTNGSIHAVNLNKGTKSTICKETNAFGFNFYYKVTSLFNGGIAGTPTEGTVQTPPAIDPMMLMMLSKDGSSDFDELLPLLMLSGSQGQLGASQMNPLLMMSLLGDKGDSGSGMDMKSLLMMQMFSGQTAGAQGTMNPLLLMSLMK